MADINPDLNISVAAVCGDEVFVYGSTEKSGRRELQFVHKARHHGDALQFAAYFDEGERQARARRQAAAAMLR